MSADIVAWDNRPFRWQRQGVGGGGVDPYNDDLSHGYVDDGDPDSLRKACSWLTLSRTARRLQSHVPELPLCPKCARLAGIPLITGATT